MGENAAVKLEALTKHLRTFGLSTEDEVIVWKCLWRAVGYWLPQDRAKYKHIEIEQFFSSPTEGGKPVIGYLDLVFDDILIVDWKTFQSKEVEDWKRRVRYGVQAQIYHTFGPKTSDGIEFRGIHKKLFTPHSVNVPHRGDNFSDVIEDMERADATRFWRRRTQSCFAFGKRCAYFDGCLGNIQDPHPAEKDPETIVDHFSSNSIDEFLLCPQRYRRRRLREIQGVPCGTEVDEDDDAAALIGTAFHSLIAIVYAVTWEKESLTLRDGSKMDLAPFRRKR